MVVDTSAIIAFLRNEPLAARIQAALQTAISVRMSAFNLYECRVVVARQSGEAMSRELDLLLSRLAAVIDPFDEEQASLAFAAYERFGRGTGHRAQLNLGDCAAYALAHSRGLPLLFVGDDFSRTDVIPALSP